MRKTRSRLSKVIDDKEGSMFRVGEKVYYKNVKGKLEYGQVRGYCEDMPHLPMIVEFPKFIRRFNLNGQHEIFGKLYFLMRVEKNTDDKV